MRVFARREKRLLGFVATETRGRPTGHELVRFMAADAVAVGGRLRCLLLGVATRARGESGGSGRMPAMAIETTLGPRVLRVNRGAFRVAGRAALRNDRGIAVQLVALRAVGRGVHRDGGESPVRLGVARNARRGFLVRCERVASQAVCFVLGVARVAVRNLVGVALHARRDARVLEPVALEVVASAARDLRGIDVCGVTEARPKLSPRSRNHGGGNVRRSPVAKYEKTQGDGHDQRDAESRRPCNALPPHGAAAWQRMHGMSCCLFFVLVKPAPCGLPPEPPTRWHPTQSCSPAPP